MSIHLLIDGYNLIRNYLPLSKVETLNFSKGREALLEWLAGYRKVNPVPITVIFDGQDKGDLLNQRDIYKGIKILYSRSAQTADDLIKRLVTQKEGNFLVVTSDSALSSYCRSHQAGSIKSEEFAKKVREKLFQKESMYNEEEPGISGTKKKGRAFRLSKKRKNDTRYWNYL